ncbi:MAG TPA: hypothetical protein V6D00_03050 [Pantanalinema sp.]
MLRESSLALAALAILGCVQPVAAPPVASEAVRAPRQAAPLAFAVQQRSGRRSRVEGGLLQVLRDWQEIGPPGFRNDVIFRSGYRYPFYYGAYYPYSGIYAYGPPISPEVEKEPREQAEAASASAHVAPAG